MLRNCSSVAGDNTKELQHGNIMLRNFSSVAGDNTKELQHGSACNIAFNIQKGVSIMIVTTTAAAAAAEEEEEEQVAAAAATPTTTTTTMTKTPPQPPQPPPQPPQPQPNKNHLEVTKNGSLLLNAAPFTIHNLRLSSSPPLNVDDLLAGNALTPHPSPPTPDCFTTSRAPSMPPPPPPARYDPSLNAQT
jgi:hypothetical protein